MMKRFFVILISCLWLAVPLFAQSNKLIRELESKRGALALVAAPWNKTDY